MKKISCQILFLLLLNILTVHSGYGRMKDSLYPRMMEARSALELLQSARPLSVSAFWPNVDPELFADNLEQNLRAIDGLFQGKATNFCGYAALSYIVIQERPVEYIESMLQLFQNGSASFQGYHLNPSGAVRQFTGQIRYKGSLDQRPADQMWFMTLADCVKGYSNWLDLTFQPGDENRLWAAVNLAKFNKTLGRMLGCTYHSKGSDLIRPGLNDPVAFVNKGLKKGWVVLYLNNRRLHPTSHRWIRPSFPDHYIVVSEMQRVQNGHYEITYWDYGSMRKIVISPKKFRKIVYALTVFDCHSISTYEAS